MQLAFASTNPHKLREIRDILGPLGMDVYAPVDAALGEAVEDADTFEGNARIKAVTYARALGRTCLADDSGLEVAALGGAPGVRSARYAGTGATREQRDRANRDRLVAELRQRGVVNSSARLVCALCVADARGAVLFEARGTLDGLIIEGARGGNGFGYDGLLLLPQLDKTVAELTAEELDALSHRGKAARALHAWFTANAHELRGRAPAWP